VKTKKEVLEKYFGFNSFRPGQEEVIDEVLNPDNKGVVCVMPTGGGKSLLYQIPSILLKGTSIIVSPLISLMKDQIDALHKNGIDAAFYNSSQSKKEQESIINSLNLGLVDLLYVSPERFADQYFLDILKDMDIALFAVDEAHLISQQGHDFRPSYRKLKRAILELNPKSVIAVTATAKKAVQDDICIQLGIPLAKRFIRGFFRDNICLEFVESHKGSRFYDIANEVKHSVEYGMKTGIIYTQTKDDAVMISEILQKDFKIPCLYYHAGLSDDKRKEIQEEWIIKGGIIAATTAMGMGIDKKDVRFVFHCGLPASIEAWSQEWGRAGRDGNESVAKTFTDVGSDSFLQKFLINLSLPPISEIKKFWYWLYNETKHDLNLKMTQEKMQEKSKCKFVSGALSVLKYNNMVETIKRGEYRVKERYSSINVIDELVDWKSHLDRRNSKLEMLKQMIDLSCNNSDCRMLQILEYFGDTSYTKPCGRCDVCQKSI